jgi:hypothetical protein
MDRDTVAAELESVRGVLAAWRAKRRRRDRIPEEVWRRATRAVGQYGLNTVSRVLGLEYYALKRRVEGSGRALPVCRAGHLSAARLPGCGQARRQAGGAARHVDRDMAGRQRRVESAPLFVELQGRRAEGAMACVVDLEKGNGTRMRICVGEAVAVDWGKLKEAFLGA